MFLLLICAAVNCAAQTKRALLIGIDTYETKAGAHASIKTKESDGPSRWSMQQWPNLKGAVNDAKAMRALLTSPKFGFSREEPYMHLLLQNDATHDRILADMRKYLVDLPKSGDVVVFYYSGHGSLRVNSLSQKSLNQNGIPLDNTIVPVDANSGVFDVRDRELARIFNAALDKGIFLTAIFDSCHSGAIARGFSMGTPSRTRFLPYDPRDIREAPDMRNGKEVIAPADRSDNAALILSASLSNQLAKEWDANNESHGAFTVALLGALEALPANTPAQDVFKRIGAVLKGMGIVDQDAKLDGTTPRRRQPLFGNAPLTGKLRVASEGMDDDGVILNAGYADNLGSGSELVRFSTAKETLRIRVDRVDGLTRSHAKIISVPNGEVEAGDLFQLEKWVPAESSLLPVWIPPTLSQRQLQNLVNQLAILRKSSNFSWVEDPAQQVPTHVISWDGKEWLLTQSGKTEVRSLGTTIRSESLSTELKGRDTRLFVNIPPATELVAQLGFNDGDVPVKVLTDSQKALYTLVGTFDGKQVLYAWLRKSAIESGKTFNPEVEDAGECSSDSPYPIRTAWVSTMATAESPAELLSQLAVRLDKVYAWLNLPAPPDDEDRSPFPYHLALRKKSDGSLVENGETVDGDQLDLVLKSDVPVTLAVLPRWVYVLTIDCSGTGTLLYPRGGIENKYPREGALANEISLLGRGYLKISPPFGTDTYILLTTDEELPDPSVLDFEGVRGTPSNSPLQNLFRSASHGFRGGNLEMPTNWSLQTIHLISHPKP